MVFSLEDIMDYHLRSQDGDFGEVKSCLIDDFDWVIRYLIVEVDGREVLLSTTAMATPVTAARVIPINLSHETIMNSPEIDSGRPLSRDIERQLSDYYKWPYYWEPDEVPNTLPGDLSAVPLIDMQLDKEAQEDQAANQASGNLTTASSEDQPHLRSTKILFGQTVHTTNDDQNAGKLADLIVQSEDWDLLYLVVDTGRLFNEKKVLLAPSWVTNIDELENRIDVKLSAQTIHDAPEFNSIDDLTEEYQVQWQNYYHKP